MNVWVDKPVHLCILYTGIADGEVFNHFLPKEIWTVNDDKFPCENQQNKNGGWN